MASPNAPKRQRGPGKPFEKGNPGGPGNPMARHVSAIKKLCLEHATPDKVTRLLDTLYDLAVDTGDVVAAREYLDRTAGKVKDQLAISDDREPGMDDARMVGIFLENGWPEKNWPPGVLALYKAGKIDPVKPGKE